MWNSARLAALVLAGLTVVPWAGTAAPGAEALPAIRDLVLFDFEDDVAVTPWTVRDLTALAPTTTWASHGTRAAAITFTQWTEGKEQWPAIVAPAKALKTTDFTPYRDLCWNAHNPQRFPIEFKLHLRDRDKRFSQAFTLGPQETVALRVSVAALGLDAAHISELHFYVTRPERTFAVFIDHVRLTPGVLEDARDLCRRAIGLEAEINERWAGIDGVVPAALQAEAEHVGVLRRQADALLQGLQDSPPRTQPQLEAVRGTLSDLAATADRLAGLTTCLNAARYAGRRGGTDFLVTPVSSMRKVFLEARRFSEPFGTEVSLCAARNEHEHAQAVVIPFGRDLANVTWEVTSLIGPGGAALPATVHLVGYVDCRQPSYAVDHTGWWPDPLLTMVTTVPHVSIGEVLPLWLSVAVPRDAAPGQYTGELRIRAEDATMQRLPVKLRVWSFTLPETPPLRTALSFRGLSSRLYPKERLPDMTELYEDWMIRQYRLNPGNIYSAGPPAWPPERLTALVKDGLNAINLAYFNAPRGDAFDAAAYWQRFDDQVRRVEAYMPVIEAAGARDLCYFYCFDERPAEQLDVVFETAQRLKQKWPDIEVMTTAYDRTFGLEREGGDAIDIWVPLTPHFNNNAERIAQARRQGRDIWWYICIGPKHPYANWFVEYTAIEPRLIMGAMAAKYRPDGFLYYAVNRWPLNDRPITSGPRTDWNPASYKNNNGDGSIMCAGPNEPLATIRLENIRDGLEDLAYYNLLRDLQARKRSLLSATSDLLTWPLRVVGLPVGPGHDGKVPRRVVQDLSHYTRDPAIVEQERRRLAREIMRLKP